MTNANAMQSECPRCKRDESYGCTCTSQEMVKWQADRIDALEDALELAETHIEAVADWMELHQYDATAEYDALKGIRAALGDGE